MLLAFEVANVWIDEAEREAQQAGGARREAIGGDRRRDELDAVGLDQAEVQGIADGVGEQVRQFAGVAVQLHAERGMDVPGQHHTVLDLPRVQGVKHPFAGDGIAVPLIGVDAEQLIGQLHAEQFDIRQGRQTQLAEHHLLAQEFPLSLRFDQIGAEPVLLDVAEQLPLGIIELDAAEGQWQLFVAPIEAGIKHDQIDQIAERELAPDALRIAGVDQPNRHPFEVDLDRTRLALRPGAFLGLVVVAGATAPGIIGRLVIIPDADHRVLALQGLHVRVTAILGVALAIVLQGFELVVRHMRAPDFASAAVLVDEVAEVKHRVQVLAGSHVPIGREVAGGIVRTGGEGKTQMLDGAHRQGARASDRGPGLAGLEPVVVAGAR